MVKKTGALPCTVRAEVASELVSSSTTPLATTAPTSRPATCDVLPAREPEPDERDDDPDRGADERDREPGEHDPARGEP